ncbi:MAG: hypothetical protein DMF99_03775 [Acidobacteria bacterium]|nr:MAG: hypothetical protein DMG03_14805 [Acidobacteriota bacterium]PYR12639.1 MAG: hypothetical protein DMF99_03775 [Acidobacteriota bacterium]
MKRSRGSWCAPPGRQSAERFSRGGAGRRLASRAASGESHSVPPENHFITMFGFVRFSWFSVGSSSCGSRARNAVGALSMRIVQ